MDENVVGLNKVQKKDRSIYQTYAVNLIPGYNTLSASAFSRGFLMVKSMGISVVIDKPFLVAFRELGSDLPYIARTVE